MQQNPSYESYMGNTTGCTSLSLTKFSEIVIFIDKGQGTSQEYIVFRVIECMGRGDMDDDDPYKCWNTTTNN